MFRKISSPSSLVLLLVALFLFATTTTVFAEKRGSDLRQAPSPNGYVQRCEVPYCISDYGFETGLHIVADWTDDVSITFRFFNGGTTYDTNTVTIGPEGWTGYASSLLSPGVSLRYPTLIYAYWNDPGEGYEGELFWITQFIFTNSGFSHQTFTSHTYGELVLY